MIFFFFLLNYALLLLLSGLFAFWSLQGFHHSPCSKLSAPYSPQNIPVCAVPPSEAPFFSLEMVHDKEKNVML